MALVSLRQLLDHAAENDYSLPAFNCKVRFEAFGRAGKAPKIEPPPLERPATRVH